MPNVPHPTVATRLARLAVALIAALPLAPPADLAAAQVAPRTPLTVQVPPGAIPPQGLYEGCAPGVAAEACVAHLATIDAAGFRYVLNYSSWYGSPAEVLRYADAATALGLQLIWPLNHPAWRGQGSLAATYPDLSGKRDLSNADLTAFAVGLVVDHPATWGFYIGDEVPRAEAEEVGALSAQLRRLAPAQPQLYVARPGAAQLRPFASFADFAGVDAYPVGSNDPPVRDAARAAAAVTAATDAQTAMVLQAFSWSQYRPEALPPLYPSGGSLLAMRNAAIRHADPAMILWYSYQDILRSDRPRRRWCELSRAAFSTARVGASGFARGLRRCPRARLAAVDDRVSRGTAPAPGFHVVRPVPGEEPPPEGLPEAPRIVHRSESGRAEVALTFDDGPSRWTAEVASAFEARDCQATFFLRGAAVAERPQTVAALAAAGHELGNHLWSHTNASTQTRGELREEIERTADAIEAAGARRPNLVRPPYFSAPEAVVEAAAGTGVSAVVLRSIGSSDWEADSAEQIVDPVLANIQPGDIVCLHDGISSDKRDSDSREPTVAAVRQLVPALLERGLRPVSVSQLLA
jgi:peptidoglycan/xylan/chitin deacetylase (PgdA/CDA1 family)